jgi:hypothetical protein
MEIAVRGRALLSLSSAETSYYIVIITILCYRGVRRINDRRCSVTARLYTNVSEWKEDRGQKRRRVVVRESEREKEREREREREWARESEFDEGYVVVVKTSQEYICIIMSYAQMPETERLRFRKSHTRTHAHGGRCLPIVVTFTIRTLYMYTYVLTRAHPCNNALPNPRSLVNTLGQQYAPSSPSVFSVTASAVSTHNRWAPVLLCPDSRTYTI